MSNNDLKIVKTKLVELETEHRDLDAAILSLSESVYPDQLQLRRLKARKLMLKDEIQRILSEMIPDLDA